VKKAFLITLAALFLATGAATLHTPAKAQSWGEAEDMPGRLVAKDITPDQECIGVLGQFQQAAALGALVVEYLRPVATLDKEEGCNDEKATPNRYRCAADGNRGSEH
jgi:hypothetical protein